MIAIYIIAFVHLPLYPGQGCETGHPEWDTSLSQEPYKHVFTQSFMPLENLEWSIVHNCVQVLSPQLFWGGGRKPKNTEETYLDTGRTCDSNPSSGLTLGHWLYVVVTPWSHVKENLYLQYGIHNKVYWPNYKLTCVSWVLNKSLFISYPINAGE